ncbi:MAG: SprT family zinc-dependent metalloprotease [Gammaproteobacteria bacterium]|nr:SprT family zinc-dependent metalloprotease [Gammaproteobacteria bacterium]
MTAYTLVRSRRRRTFCLQIDPEGALRVLVPASAGLEAIESFVREHARWIERTQARLQERPAPPPLVDGARIPYLDGLLALAVQPPGARPRRAARDGDCLRVPGADDATIRRQIELWYRQEAYRHGIERIVHFAPLVGRAPQRLRIAGQKTRWGSCSARGTISLNWRLMMVPAILFDYVVAHELCHLLCPHHGTGFWREMARVMPDYATHRKNLRAQGGRFAL